MTTNNGFCFFQSVKRLNGPNSYGARQARLSDGLFYITMEYLPEARNNQVFHGRLVPVVQTFHDALDAVWTTLAGVTGLPPDRSRVMLNATMRLIRGMVAQSVLRDKPEYFSQILTYWKQHLLTELVGTTSETPAQAPVQKPQRRRAARPDRQKT